MNHGIEWVKLAKYVELTGDSADAVHGRRRLGKWKDGYHCKVADGCLWVNLTHVEKWVLEWDASKPNSMVTLRTKAEPARRT